MVRTLCACTQISANKPLSEGEGEFELVRRSGEKGIYRCSRCNNLFELSGQECRPLEVTHYPTRAVMP